MPNTNRNSCKKMNGVLFDIYDKYLNSHGLDVSCKKKHALFFTRKLNRAKSSPACLVSIRDKSRNVSHSSAMTHGEVFGIYNAGTKTKTLLISLQLKVTEIISCLEI